MTHLQSLHKTKSALKTLYQILFLPDKLEQVKVPRNPAPPILGPQPTGSKMIVLCFFHVFSYICQLDHVSPLGGRIWGLE